jgi:hypothetical protein
LACLEKWNVALESHSMDVTHGMELQSIKARICGQMCFLIEDLKKILPTPTNSDTNPQGIEINLYYYITHLGSNLAICSYLIFP